MQLLQLSGSEMPPDVAMSARTSNKMKQSFRRLDRRTLQCVESHIRFALTETCEPIKRRLNDRASQWPS